MLRPQPLFDYDTGGKPHSTYKIFTPGLNATHPGFQACLAVRYKQWKWVGLTGKVYRCVRVVAAGEWRLLDGTAVRLQLVML